jgi:hypothetical protein
MTKHDGGSFLSAETCLLIILFMIKYNEREISLHHHRSSSIDGGGIHMFVRSIGATVRPLYDVMTAIHSRSAQQLFFSALLYL